MTITRLTSAITLPAGAMATMATMAVMPGAGAAARPGRIGLEVSASADHLRPLPGETQVLRWSVGNAGGTTLRQVRLDVEVPADWLLRESPGCRADGPVLRCALGTLQPAGHAVATIRMAVPAHPRLGPVVIPGRTSALSGGEAGTGPSTALRVTVVRHR